MLKSLSSDRWLGLFFITFSLALIFIWIPLDVETGYLEKVRRSVILGDSLAPTVAGLIMLLGGLMLLFKPSGESEVGLSRQNLVWLFLLLLLIVLSMVLMRYAGPVIAVLLNVEEGYRPLRDTLPWKYIGFLLGGTFLTFSLMTLVDRHFSWLRLVIALIATLLIAMFYDLPFDNLLLPPNGDV